MSQYKQPKEIANDIRSWLDKHGLDGFNSAWSLPHEDPRGDDIIQGFLVKIAPHIPVSDEGPTLVAMAPERTDFREPPKGSYFELYDENGNRLLLAVAPSWFGERLIEDADYDDMRRWVDDA